MIRRNPESEPRIRKELAIALYSDELEKALWLLYNPTGFCEKCGLDWDSLSCSCRNCEYDELDIINEPCRNHQFCICDYLPTSYDIYETLINEELTQNERDYVHNIDVDVQINDDFVYLVILLIREYENASNIYIGDLEIYRDKINKILYLLQKNYKDYLNIEILFKNIEIDKLTHVNEKLKLLKAIYKIINNYFSNVDKNIFTRYLITNIDITVLNKKYIKLLEYIINQVNQSELDDNTNHIFDTIKRNIESL